MHCTTTRRFLSMAVILLFFGFSTNAFACLVPLYGVPNMEAGCPSESEQPAQVFCDVFKAGVPAHSSHLYPPAVPICLPPFESDSLALMCNTTVRTRNLDSSTDRHPQTLFFKTTILRI